MSTHGDDKPDPIDDAWREVGDADAGRPSAAHRAAILAQAAAVAAARRTPANDPWFRRRALAGVAGSLALAGIAVLLWRETARDPSLPASVPPPAIPAPVTASPPPARELAEALPAAPRDEAPSATRGLRLEPQTEAEARSRARAAPSPAALESTVEEAFPGLLQADRPPRAVWILKDAAGRILRAGLVDTGETFSEVAERLRQEMPTQRIEPFETGTVAVAAGSRVQVGVARIR